MVLSSIKVGLFILKGPEQVQSSFILRAESNIGLDKPSVAFVNVLEDQPKFKMLYCFRLSPAFTPFPLLLLLSKPEIYTLM